MTNQTGTKKIGYTALAGFLWLLTAALGLQTMYTIKDIYFLSVILLHGSTVTADRVTPWLLFLLALIYLAFIVITTEYHSKRLGKPESWKLFGWTVLVELIPIIIYLLM